MNTGAPSGTLDEGENMNVRKGVTPTLETYGQYPSFDGTANRAPTGATGSLTVAARPTTDIRAPYAQHNRAVLFRRALKLVRGGNGQIVRPGLTIAAENPVYIQGDWNTGSSPPSSANIPDPTRPMDSGYQWRPSAIVADSITLLSNSWRDVALASSERKSSGTARSMKLRWVNALPE